VNKRTVIAAGLSLVVVLILIFVIGRAKRTPGENKSILQAESLYQSALSLEAKGKLREAAKLYQELKKESPNFKQISDVEKRLWDLNMKILFSPAVTEKDTVYKVRPQDTLTRIAAKHNTTVDLIMDSNNLKSDLIRPGDRLKISAAEYSVIIDKSQNSLALKADDEIFKVYSVATGKYNYTPAGTFKIVEKLKNPDWYKPGEEIVPVPAGSPKNILGTRWLGLSEPKYGIHGGASIEDLGKHSTDGCIRMLDSEVEELFTVLPRGTEVIIVE